MRLFLQRDVGRLVLLFLVLSHHNGKVIGQDNDTSTAEPSSLALTTEPSQNATQLNATEVPSLSSLEPTVVDSNPSLLNATMEPTLDEPECYNNLTIIF